MAGPPKTAVVVGAGIGGLVTAGRLAKSGFKVTVVEKNKEDDVGGRMNERLLGGKYRFETGPSLMLLPGVYREAFAALGARLEDHVAEIVRVDPCYSIFFEEDGDVVRLCGDSKMMEAQLEALEPGSYQNYCRYLDAAQANLDAGLPNFIRGKLSISGFDRFIGNVFGGFFPLENHQASTIAMAQLRRWFRTDKLRALMSFQDLYVGLSPYDAPAVFSLLQAIELNEGVYYPRGGFHQIAKGLHKICREELGVNFVFRDEAVQVTVQDRAGGGVRATGVALRSGAQVPADVVVSNVDLPQGEQLLLPAALREGGLLEGKKFSSSVVAFYWALDKRFDQLSHHSVFLSNDYEESWASIFSRNEMPRSGNFYVHAPARTDPSVCPEGHDAIMVLVPCPVLSSASNDGDQGPSFQQQIKNLKQQARDLVLRRFTEAGMTDFESHIVDEFIYSPVEWKARYNLGRGAVFGLAHGLDQLAVFRPGAAHPRVAGLYRVGASARPGNGVPLV
ncbi:unnamed protein product, partial [Heterosigma akashiwo]